MVTSTPTPILTPRLEPEIIHITITPEPTVDPYTVKLEEFRKLSINLYSEYSNLIGPINDEIEKINTQREQEIATIRNLSIPMPFIANRESQANEKYDKLISPLYDRAKRINAEYEQKVTELSRIYGFYPLYPKLP
jgi:hypothetical protein